MATPAPGRLADPIEIVEAARQILLHGAAAERLDGLHVVVTAGGTREPIDAVRVIANRSSGKQGHALAAEAAARGARVTLITTVDLDVPPSAVVDRVETAAEMEAAVHRVAASADVVIMAAAVADFRPAKPADGKLKKQRRAYPRSCSSRRPTSSPGSASMKPAGQTLVGFAAETDDLVANAESKLVAKNLDLIVANDVSAPSIGFAHDTNAVTLVRRGGQFR